MISDNKITCTIECMAQLIGFEARNNSDMSDYIDNIQYVLHGKIWLMFSQMDKHEQLK
jgi:hypothetical protein